MRSRFHRSCELVFRLHKHRDALIKRTLINLIPVLANYDPAYFADQNLGDVMGILTEQLRKDRDRATRDSVSQSECCRRCKGKHQGLTLLESPQHSKLLDSSLPPWEAR